MVPTDCEQLCGRGSASRSFCGHIEGEVVRQVSRQSHAWAQSLKQRLRYQFCQLICDLLLARDPVETEDAETHLLTQKVGTNIDGTASIQVVFCC